MAEGLTFTTSLGRRMSDVLAAQRMFLSNVYEMLRVLERETTQRGWTLIRPNGYVVARNGWGSSLASFSSGDWVLTQLGLAFVDDQRTALDASTGSTVTDVGRQLELLAFQVRWLDKSPEEPVVWAMKLLAIPETDGGGPKRWEAFHAGVFNRVKADESGVDQSAINRLVELNLSAAKGAGRLLVSGCYRQVALAVLQSPSDVVDRVINPGVSMPSAAPAD